MRKLLLILLLIPFFVDAQVWQQNNLEYGHQFKGLKATRAFLLPLTQTTAGQGRDTGAVYYRLADSSLYVWTGSQWRQVTGGGVTTLAALTDVTITGNSDSTVLQYDSANGVWRNQSIANALTGGETTVFEVVLDSTGQQNNRLLFAKNNKISSDSRLLWDETNRKLVIGNTNVSVGGPNTKLWVNGNVNFGGTTSTGALSIGSLTGILKGTSGTVSTAVAGTDYQAPITLTTTGSSGAATFVGNTLNIPQYSGGSTTLNNSGTGFNVAVEGTNKVKRLFGGTGIQLDSTTTDSTIIIQNSATGGVWERQGTAIQANINLTLDDQTAGEPSVIIDENPVILTGHERVFKMWYTTGWVSNPKTNYAESADGITWTPYASNPVINGVCRSYVLKTDSNYILYSAANAGGPIDRYTSSNGISWTLRQSNIISSETFNVQGNFNIGVLIDGATWYMMVEGRNGSGVYSLGLYTSPDGVTWTTSGVNPVISGLSQGGAFLKKIGGYYYNWCHAGSASSILPSDLKRYRSTDMINWTDEGYVFQRRELDEGPNTEFGQVADPYILAVDSSLYLYYGATTNGSALVGNYKIKVAIAPYSFSEIVETSEGDKGNVHGNKSQWKQIDNNISYSAGKIGIGTDAPATLVDIYTNVAGTQTTRMKSGSANVYLNYSAVNNANLTASFGITPSTYSTYGALTNNNAIMYNTTSTTFMNDAGGSVFKWATGGSTEQMRLDANGRLLLGTSSGGSGLLELSSTTRGLLLPRMTKAQRDAISSPVAGLMVYQTDNTPGLRVYNGTNWMRYTETAD